MAETGTQLIDASDAADTVCAECEQHILGFQFRGDSGAIEESRSIIGDDFSDFFKPHDRIQGAIFAASTSGTATTPAAIALQLANDSGLAKIGGVGYLRSLAEAAPATADTARALRIEMRTWRETKRRQDFAARMEKLSAAFKSGDPQALAGLIALGHEASESASSTIVATPFSWREPEQIPRRQWVFGRHAVRRYVSATGADGGIGKTALALAECISVVTGKPLLNDGPVQRAPAWYIGLEDDPEEYERRIVAAALAHNINPGELRGGFFWNSGRKQNFVVAWESREGLQIERPVVEGIIRQIREHGIGLLVVDPFVSSHEVSEQDNTKINFVMRQWAQIAHMTNSAIELVHHSKKGVGQNGETSADDLRGASALVRAARSVRVLSQMTKDEAARAGVDNRRRFFQVHTPKVNMTLPAEEGIWRELVTIDLRNGDDFHPADYVQAVKAWRFPDASDACSVEQIETILARVRDGQFRESSQAKQWVGLVVADVLGLDATDARARESIKTAIRAWLKDGTLVIVEALDDARKPRKFIGAGR